MLLIVANIYKPMSENKRRLNGILWPLWSRSYLGFNFIVHLEKWRHRMYSKRKRTIVLTWNSVLNVWLDTCQPHLCELNDDDTKTRRDAEFSIRMCVSWNVKTHIADSLVLPQFKTLICARDSSTIYKGWDVNYFQSYHYLIIFLNMFFIKIYLFIYNYY